MTAKKQPITNPIKIAVVDDATLLTDLVADFLNTKDNLEVCMKAYSGNEFLAKLTTTSTLPSIVLLDLKMNDGTGLEVAKVLKVQYPSIKIIVLSSLYKPYFLSFMLKEGIHAFLPKEVDKHSLINIIFDVYERGHYFTPEQMEALRQDIGKKPNTLFISAKTSLTKREIEILKLCCRQYTAQEIAKKLFISKKTVEAHKSNLLLKTGAKNLVGLTVFALQKKLVKLDELFVSF